MNTNALRLIGCLAWSVLAVASSAPVNARALSLAAGSTYASCSANYITDPHVTCSSNWNYLQTIHFVSVGCNQGCASEDSSTSTDVVYPAGRKVVTSEATCTSGFVYHIYQLGSCAC
jgi:hypothetical protein